MSQGQRSFPMPPPSGQRSIPLPPSKDASGGAATPPKPPVPAKDPNRKSVVPPIPQRTSTHNLLPPSSPALSSSLPSTPASAMASPSPATAPANAATTSPSLQRAPSGASLNRQPSQPSVAAPGPQTPPERPSPPVTRSNPAVVIPPKTPQPAPPVSSQSISTFVQSSHPDDQPDKLAAVQSRFNITPEQVEDLKKLFARMDVNCDGIITFNDFLRFHCDPVLQDVQTVRLLLIIAFLLNMLTFDFVAVLHSCITCVEANVTLSSSAVVASSVSGT